LSVSTNPPGGQRAPRHYPQQGPAAGRPGAPRARRRGSIGRSRVRFSHDPGEGAAADTRRARWARCAMDESALLETAIAAAREAGALARARLGMPGYLRWKGIRDLVTGSVLEVQALLLERLHAAFPDHAIPAEESADTP